MSAMYKVEFKKPNGIVVKMRDCQKVEFIFNGAIVKVTDVVGDFLYINTRECLIYEGRDGERDGN